MKYVLITGASQGLGRELVKVFNKNGFNVIIGYNINEDLAKKLCSECNSKYNVKNIVKRIDITSEECIKKLFFEYDIEIVINNACLCIDNYIEDKSLDEFMKVLKVNLGGTYLVCKYASNTKIIINISSKDGIDTYNPISLDYCSSKAGIINLTKNLSLYYKDKYIYCVCPVWIDTESVINMNPAFLQNEMKRVGQDKLLKKEDVAIKIYGLTKCNLKNGSVLIIDE